ncbi:MAG: substrate-binding domain-containing protein [Bryobacteraceae bacterium]
MKTARWALTAAIIPAAFLLTTSCTTNPHAPAEKYFLVSTNTKLPYWQSASAGLIHATNEMKVHGEMIGPDTYDPKAEHDDFQRAVAQKPAGILISAADASVMTPDIDAAMSQGIPVVTMDSDAPDSKRLFFVGTDNYNAGTLGGHLTSKLIGGKGNVVIFTMPNQANLQDRLHGYQAAFAEHSDIKVMQVVDIHGDPTAAFDAARKLIDSKAKVDAFVCLEAIACPEVGEVISRANMSGKITVVAMDTDQRTMDWIQKGVISATIAQKPFTMAYYGAKMLGDIHLNPPKPLTGNWANNPTSPIPTFIDTGTFIVDKSSVNAFMDANKAATSTSGQ